QNGYSCVKCKEGLTAVNGECVVVCLKVCCYLLKSVLLFAQKCVVICSKVYCYLLKSMLIFAQKCVIICSKVICYLYDFLFLTKYV
ncbi:MAG: hypothetical protein J6R41_07550, partial [Paludibacteraceae bacterium]|nr:hypothetical protein [Paludibacteraceae bacterium]